MNLTETGFEGLVIVRPDIYADKRGYFFESYNERAFKEAGLHTHFVQDNQSLSRRGVIRGLHYQLEPHAQAKLVRVIYGRVYDVAVDIRKGSATFGEYFGLELSGRNKLQLYIPKGYAHGFSVLSPVAVVLYKTDEYYDPGSERGIAFNDPDLGIDWKVPSEISMVSERDRKLPRFSDAEMNFNR